MAPAERETAEGRTSAAYNCADRVQTSGREATEGAGRGQRRGRRAALRALVGAIVNDAPSLTWGLLVHKRGRP